ncbi:MAG TPA: mechanosensitive ion channel family protein [Burkholderiales bacterium]|nr:mechanosensitive ion channel family protein [Burkholderiales bacterium]
MPGFISLPGAAPARQGWHAAALIAALLLSAGWAIAAGPGASAPRPGIPSAQQPTPLQTVARPTAPPEEFGRGTPRGTMAGFLSATNAGDYKRATAYLDLRALAAPEAAQQGRVLARHLRVVLDQNLALHPDDFSDEPGGTTDDGQPPSRDVVGRIQTKKGPVTVLLERVPREDGVPVWQFSTATVARIPGLYQEEFGHGPVGEILPPVLIETRLLEIALWQWLALLALVPASFFLAWILVGSSLRLLRPLATHSRLALTPRVAERAAAPLRLLVAVTLFHVSRRVLSLAVAVQPAFAKAEEMLVVVGLAWLILRVIDLAGGNLREDAERRTEPATIALIALAQRGLTLVVLALGLFSLLEVAGVHVTALIAGLGVGGIAIALAAQKTVEHLFGGVSLVADQPVKVGDFCRFGNQVGTVEAIGLRSTRIRTLERTLISVPNAELATLQIENFAKRDRIWLSTTFGLRRETTPDQLRYVLVRVRELLYAHPMIDPDPARVRLVGFGSDSLEVEIFAYVRTRDYNQFLAVREDVYLRILDILAESGTGLALPSMSLHRGADGLDPDRAREAEAAVRRWREEGALPFPEFPPERVARLARTIDYPASGLPEPRRSAAAGPR